jgi:hypothetical protein
VPSYRVVWEFAESNGSGFNEVYYVDAASVAAATQATPALIAARLAMLHNLNRLLRIRASDVAQNRVTANRGVNLPGTSSAYGAPLAVGCAVVIQLAGAAGSARKLWMRGVPDDLYLRNATTGQDDPPAALLNSLNVWFSVLALNTYGIRRLTPSGVGLYYPRKILQVDGSALNGQSICTLDAAPGYAVPSRVVIGGASKKDLPALNGHYTVTAINNALITIPYQTPGGLVIKGGKATMRQETYSAVDVFVPGSCSFDHYGTRTSRSPLTRSRGARRAARIRSLV